MKKLFLLCVLLMTVSCGVSDKSVESPVVGDVTIIPLPKEVTRLGGEFDLTANTTLVVTDDAGMLAANAINEILTESYGLTPLHISSDTGNANSIVLEPRQPSEGQTDESYELSVEPGVVKIAGTASGLFYGAQSLIQMIPRDVSNGIRIPAVLIKDAPRYRYRGFHLDEARHLMGADFVKKYISLAARYKLNYFHWHLTDDQGWRIAIEKYPLLTEIGSKRPESVKADVYLNKQPYIGDGKPVEGFYTREQIADIVAFAKAHSVIIIPEIEMPGHASAAIAAYPKYGCSPGTKVKTTWSAQPDGFADILCPSDETIAFLKDVLDEVIDMFPDSPYIHVGADETNMSQWKSSKVVQEIKAREDFTDEYQVLKWFIDQIGAHVESRGKKIICWDDMIEKGQYPNAVIMSWKGPEVARRAALANKLVILAPYERLYFDHPQSDTAEEARSFPPVVTLKSVLHFNVMPKRPIPEETRNIIGGEGCVWTEFIETPSQAEYMAFPRLIALADVLWSGNGNKDFREFVAKRLFNEFDRLDRMPDGKKVNYRIPEPFDTGTQMPTGNEPIKIELMLPIADGRIFYTTDGSIPDITASSGQTGGFIMLPPGFAGKIKAVVKAPDRISSVFEANLVRAEPNFTRKIHSDASNPKLNPANTLPEVIERAKPVTRAIALPNVKPVKNGKTETEPPRDSK